MGRNSQVPQLSGETGLFFTGHLKKKKKGLPQRCSSCCKRHRMVEVDDRERASLPGEPPPGCSLECQVADFLPKPPLCEGMPWVLTGSPGT